MASASPLKPPVRSLPTYKPARRPARFAVGALIVATAAFVVRAALEVVMVLLLSSSLDDPSSPESFDRILLRDDLAVVADALLLTFLASGVAVMVWMTRVYANLEALGPGAKRYSTAWAWAGWLVPIMAFFRPKQVVNDVWRASSSRDRLPQWLFAWWAVWVAAGLAMTVLEATDPDTVDGFRNHDVANAVVSLAYAAAGLLTVRLVRRATQLQADHHARLPQRGPEFVPQPPRPAGGDSEFTIEPAWAPSEEER